MTRIQLKSRVGSDGILTLTVPLDREEAGREVIVNIQSAEPSKPAKMTQEEWKRFIEETAGSISDPTFKRHDQGEYENREPLA